MQLMIEDIINAADLPDSYAGIVDRWWRPLATMIARRHAALGRPALIGINGAQGTGKSTLCLFLEVLLRDEHGLAAATLSLDDLYLTRAERRALADHVHPLFATRGVPGTHDLALGEELIDAVLGGSGPTPLPRFDKSSDDRAPAAAWPNVTTPIDVLLFEGWCIGATPIDAADLAVPVNALEQREDRDLRWRIAWNEALAGRYAALFARIDMLIMLKPPGFAQIRAWRRLQEAKLRARAGGGMTDAEIDRFVDHYERLTRHMLATLPGRADIVVPIGADHAPEGEPAYKSTTSASGATAESSSVRWQPAGSRS
jgi:D-glycerate 3-kinase